LSRVSVSRRYDAPPEAVFDAWLDPARARKFLFATPTGEMVRVEIDGRAGGSFVITERRNGEDIEHAGEYLEVDRPRRIAFAFAVPKYSTERTHVTIDIVPAGSGGAELMLTQEDVLAGYEERTREGWKGILEGLAGALSLRRPDGRE
jgi:uncharacterized protein YndB with AHSA1/START domain